MKMEVELKEQSKRGKEAEERHEKEEGLLRKSLEDTRKREEEQDKTIKRLRKENCKLLEENLRNEGIWTKKFEDLTERVLSLGNDVEMLKKEREKEASRTHVQGRETGGVWIESSSPISVWGEFFPIPVPALNVDDGEMRSCEVATLRYCKVVMMTKMGRVNGDDMLIEEGKSRRWRQLVLRRREE
ncbi:uncharacterized protein G2W53_027721 [Senna tora]|uniref:Uncharacterized protein n=1 Tax=Senna tora TaxID=362788 RepID=A0A834TK33_9FABA|nr:uncharacterized protein G2W53_027721 [Senna tora]